MGVTITTLCCVQFAAWVKSDLIADLRCFYDPDKRCLQSIVQLGRCVSLLLIIWCRDIRLTEHETEVVLRTVESVGIRGFCMVDSQLHFWMRASASYFTPFANMAACHLLDLPSPLTWKWITKRCSALLH